MRKNLLAFLLAGSLAVILACQSTGAVVPEVVVTNTQPVEIVPTVMPENGSATVTAYVLHLRSNAGIDAPVIYWLKMGSVVNVLGPCDADGWRQVQAGDLTGWVNADYLDKGCQ